MPARAGGSYARTGRRDLANVRANPNVVITAPFGSFDATVAEIADPDFRRRVFTDSQIGWYRSQSELDHLVAAAPMIGVDFRP